MAVPGNVVKVSSPFRLTIGSDTLWRFVLSMAIHGVEKGDGVE